ncbi:hypothetical protein [Cochleicola gelatinilyticus]|uniref:Uncharacterized protein n=1 Tax=Cochleicola gelatinilyticus TaxID=1763537 RepID=A0A167F561_9FLAO|nr:hypothetical protein [Cochleicola gelatinilyticus]OAB76206.1 hypothetical protein ULVI_14235 [Cochleicola gelatinilyticus]
MGRRKALLLTIAITITAGMMILFGTSSDCEYLIKNETEKYFSGILIEKKRENGIPLMVLSDHGKFKNISLHGETTGARAFLKIGDSIVKKAGELNLTIFRNNTMYTHDLRYNCQELTNNL